MTGTLFGVAILSAVIRIYVRAIKLKQFAIEDGLLLFAVAVLCAVTVLCYLTLNKMYNLIDLILLGMGDQLLLDVIMSIPKEYKEANAMSLLWWLVLFPVKFAYLFFFRKLVLRLGKIKTWWWCVTVFMVCADSVYHYFCICKRHREFFYISEAAAESVFVGSCRDSLLCCYSVRLSLYRCGGDYWYLALTFLATTYVSNLRALPSRTLFRTIGRYQTSESNLRHHSF